MAGDFAESEVRPAKSLGFHLAVSKYGTCFWRVLNVSCRNTDPLHKVSDLSFPPRFTVLMVSCRWAVCALHPARCIASRKVGKPTSFFVVDIKHCKGNLPVPFAPTFETFRMTAQEGTFIVNITISCKEHLNRPLPSRCLKFDVRRNANQDPQRGLDQKQALKQGCIWIHLHSVLSRPCCRQLCAIAFYLAEAIRVSEAFSTACRQDTTHVLEFRVIFPARCVRRIFVAQVPPLC